MSVERFRARQSFLCPTDRHRGLVSTPIFAAIAPNPPPLVTYFPSCRGHHALFLRENGLVCCPPFTIPTCRINTLSRTTRYPNIPGNTIKPIHGACVFPPSPFLFFLFSLSHSFSFFYNDTRGNKPRFVSSRLVSNFRR